MQQPSPTVTAAVSVKRYKTVQPTMLQGRSGSAWLSCSTGNYFECTLQLLDAHGTQSASKMVDEKGKPLEKITLIYQPLADGKPVGKQVKLVATRHKGHALDTWSGVKDTWDIIRTEGIGADEASHVTPMLNQMGTSLPLGECRIDSVHVERLNEKSMPR